ncbi:MAG: phage major capsid protein, partial [Pseudomonadota bacterium]
MTLAELLAKQTKLKQEAETLLAAAEADGRDYTDAEDLRLEEIRADLTDVEDAVAAAKKRQERRRALGLDNAPAAADPAPIRRAAMDFATSEPDPARTWGYANVAEFANAVRNASDLGSGRPLDPRLLAAPTNVHQGGAASGEGYELPPQFRDEIWSLVPERSDFLSVVDAEPTSAREV